MQAESKNQSEKLWKIIAFTGLLLCAGLAVWGYQSGYFHSADSLQKFIMQFGGFGMALFIAVQIVQVVFPILPGGISCLAGVMLYGPWIGFFCNYVGICIGSMAAFAIARNLGRTAFEKKCEKERCRKCGTASGADDKRDRSPDCHKLERSGCGTHQHCFSRFSAGSMGSQKTGEKGSILRTFYNGGFPEFLYRFQSGGSAFPTLDLPVLQDGRRHPDPDGVFEETFKRVWADSSDLFAYERCRYEILLCR